jgi:hypothetical protein
MADTLADHRGTSGDSRDTNMGSHFRGLRWWSVIRAEIYCFFWFIVEMIWIVILAALLITGIMVAVDHSFMWGLVITAVILYTMERTM